jgi:hypothetical protein
VSSRSSGRRLTANHPGWPESVLERPRQPGRGQGGYPATAFCIDGRFGRGAVAEGALDNHRCRSGEEPRRGGTAFTPEDQLELRSHTLSQREIELDELLRSRERTLKELLDEKPKTESLSPVCSGR